MREAHEDVTLSPEADRALRSVVRRDVELASECLKEVQAAAPLAAVCINFTQDESMALPDLLFARADDFAREAEELEDWMDLWSPNWYPEDDLVEPPVIDDEEFAEAEQVLAEALEPLVLDPYRWVMLRVARELNANPPVALTEDGLFFVLNEDFGDDVIDELRFVAPAEKFERLRARGLIGEPERA